jgi:GMP synthase-like glutamine amidotransferase
MRIHCLQHVPFEGPARIAHWAEQRGHALTSCHLHAGDPLPQVDTFDRLVIMGGPMGVGDEAELAWLKPEKSLIAEAVASGRSVVGICLGAQLLAEVLGAQVYPNGDKEIGWFPIEWTEAARAHPLCQGLPTAPAVFHWHGDTFDLPPGVLHLATSAACRNQAFLADGRLLGLQFHLESTPRSVAAICAHCAAEIVPGPYIQEVAQMHGVEPGCYRIINGMLETLMDRLPGGG